jgi:hypothetical protein
MNQTFQNSAQVLSIGVFFTLMIIGLASNLPHTLSSGLQAHGVSATAASSAAHTPPVSVLFAAFLGYNPIEHLVGAHVLGTLSAANRATLAGRSFFPHLISGPFRTGLHEAFLFAILACLIAAAASLLRGGKFHYAEATPARAAADGAREEQREAVDDGEAVEAGILQESFDSGAGPPARTTTAEEQHAR